MPYIQIYCNHPMEDGAPCEAEMGLHIRLSGSKYDREIFRDEPVPAECPEGHRFTDEEWGELDVAADAATRAFDYDEWCQGERDAADDRRYHEWRNGDDAA